MYELAGEVGVDPDPYNLRMLAWMTRGSRRQIWNQSIAHWEFLANWFRFDVKKGEHKPPISLTHLNPYADKPKPAKAKLRVSGASAIEFLAGAWNAVKVERSTDG